MARPKKNNAEYYTHDADMRNDVKIKALRRKFSHTGYAVWNYLLETLTDSDFFEVEWEEINIELLAADYDVSVEELTEIVEYCVKIGLLQLENDVLRSDAHQNRFRELLDNRVKKSEAGKKGMVKRWGQNDNIVIENDNSVIENDNSVITPLQKTITENNKVKESKVKESKGEESKENNNIDRESKKAETAKRFAPPSVDEVQSYISEKNYSVDAESFVAFYQSKNWFVGKNKMKDWHAAIVTWEKRNNDFPAKKQTPTKNVNDIWEKQK